MFSFFKRSDKESHAVVAKSSSSTGKPRKYQGPDLRGPMPLPQVIEGNEDSDWAMWEDSVLEQDSQMHSQFHEQFHDTVPSEFPHEQHAETDPDADPFATVGKHAA